MVRQSDWALPQVVAGGIPGAICLEAFVAGLTPRLGPPTLDYVQPLGTLFSTGLGLPESKQWLMRGWVCFLAGAIAWALIYACYLPDGLPGPGWLQRVAYGGLGAFLISSLLFFRVAGVIHPEIRGGHAPAPSLLGMGLSARRGGLADLAGDCAFGPIVGALYRRLDYASVHNQGEIFPAGDRNNENWIDHFGFAMLQPAESWTDGRAAGHTGRGASECRPAEI